MDVRDPGECVFGIPFDIRLEMSPTERAALTTDERIGFALFSAVIEADIQRQIINVLRYLRGEADAIPPTIGADTPGWHGSPRELYVRSRIHAVLIDAGLDMTDLQRTPDDA